MIVGLFRILIFILLFYLLMRLIRYIIAPRSSGRMNDPASRSRSSRNEGEVTIDHIPDKKKTVEKNRGEYVDFEELDSG